jgi:hypothetical protein
MRAMDCLSLACRSEVRDHPFWGYEVSLEDLPLPRQPQFERFISLATAQHPSPHTHGDDTHSDAHSPYARVHYNDSDEDDEDKGVDDTLPYGNGSVVEELRMSLGGDGDDAAADDARRGHSRAVDHLREGDGAAERSRPGPLAADASRRDGLHDDPGGSDDEADGDGYDEAAAAALNTSVADAAEQRLRLLDVVLTQVP